MYNYFANLLRAIGNSVVPLAFLAVSAILNVILDLVCVLVLDWGVKGAAVATVFSQYVSGVGIGLYTLKSSRSSARNGQTAGGTGRTLPIS